MQTSCSGKRQRGHIGFLLGAHEHDAPAHWLAVASRFVRELLGELAGGKCATALPGTEAVAVLGRESAVVVVTHSTLQSKNLR